MMNYIREAWKLGSIKLAAIVGILATIVASNQTIALGLVYFLPQGKWRIVVAIVIGIIVFVIPTWTRLAGRKKSGK